MKFLLTIGSSHWLTDNAAAAGKIADLVAGLVPVDIDYATDEPKSRHVIKKNGWQHEIRFETEKSPVVTAEEFLHIKTEAAPAKVPDEGGVAK